MFLRKQFRKGVILLWLAALTIGLRGAGQMFQIFSVTGVGQGPAFFETPDVGANGLKYSPSSYEPLSLGASRHLLSLPNCTPRAVEQFPRDLFTNEERAKGAILLHVLVVIYMFLALSIVCDSYFVPSLEVLCELFHLQTDVAGATFMAAGSSAPELAAAVIGVFVAKDDVGLSTVVGSAIYNVMFVISVCGFAAKTVVQLSWWPLIRDCLAYLISIAALIFVIDDEVITWYESIIFLALYALYILFMFFNKPLEKLLVPKFKCCPKGASSVPDQVIVHYEKMVNGDVLELDDISETTIVLTKNGNAESTESLDSNSSSNEEVATEIHKAIPDESIWHMPSGKCACIMWVVSFPLSFILFITVPDCRKDRWRKWFWVTFTMSLVWLSVFSFLMVWMITIIGFTVNIPDSVMSLTFVAFGVSLPDVVASVLVIKDGLGDMAVSNAVGSNVFDILVCLGIPWFLQTCIMKPGSVIQVYSEGLVYSSITLLSTVALLIVCIHLNKWTLDKRISVIFLLIYVAYTALASLYELNVFGYFHPKECYSDY